MQGADAGVDGWSWPVVLYDGGKDGLVGRTAHADARRASGRDLDDCRHVLDDARRTGDAVLFNSCLMTRQSCRDTHAARVTHFIPITVL